MFLGPIDVRSSKKDIQLKVKEEYNGYRVVHCSILSTFGWLWFLFSLSASFCTPNVELEDRVIQ